MKLPSFHYLFQESTAAFKRFPFAIINVLIGTSLAVFLLDLPSDQQDEYPAVSKWLMVAGLGIALFTALVVLAEKKKWTPARTLIAQGAGVLILAAYYFSLPASLGDAPELHVIRYILFAMAVHFLVSFAPFTGRGEINGFWQFNKTLFLRFLTAALFSGVLYGGLCIALASADKLLGIDIDGKRYIQLWAVIAGMFNTWFFLSGVPKDLDALERQADYPKGLKVFTQYVLIPLVVIYLLILYLYTGKIVIEWQWPNGWVANLVLGFSITGILSLLLVHPIKERAESVWVRFFSRWYYVALVPLVALLVLSIWQRISEYGITENRYFVIILGAWLAGIVLYTLLAKVQNIKVIPISLCLLAFLTAVGPWSAFAVSRENQLRRLESLLAANGLLTNGKAQKGTGDVSFADTKDISSITRYIVSTHGVNALQYLFGQDLYTTGADSGKSDEMTRAANIVALVGLKYINEWQGQPNDNFNFNAKYPWSAKIAGYDHLLHFSRNKNSPRTAYNDDYTVDSIRYRLDFDAERSTLVVHRSDITDDSLVISLGSLVKDLDRQYPLEHNYDIPVQQMQVGQDSRLLRALVNVRSLTGLRHGEDPETISVEGELLIGRK